MDISNDKFSLAYSTFATMADVRRFKAWYEDPEQYHSAWDDLRYEQAIRLLNIEKSKAT